jgi:hypothetical protein
VEYALGFIGLISVVKIALVTGRLTVFQLCRVFDILYLIGVHHSSVRQMAARLFYR